MTKKQKNRKHISQNLRNWVINQNYILKIKNLAKYILQQLKFFLNLTNLDLKSLIKLVISKNIYLLTSLLDKSLKKNVFHKNSIIKKKQKLSKLISLLNI
jgi:ribosomal protein S20